MDKYFHHKMRISSLKYVFIILFETNPMLKYTFRICVRLKQILELIARITKLFRPRFNKTLVLVKLGFKNTDLG